MRRFVILLALAGLLVAGCSANPLADDPAPTPEQTDAPAATQTPAPTAPEATPTSEPTATPEQADPTPTTAPTEAPTESATADATPTGESQDGQQSGNLEEQIDQIEQNVSELRGLEVQSETDVQIISREQLRENLKELIADEYSPEQAARDAEALWLLRLIENRNLDLYQLQIDLLSEQVVGYYSPESDELFVITENNQLSASDRSTLAHEIVHSLQDQHFNLEEMQEAAPNSDQETALTSLIEGDATLSMSGYVVQYFSSEELSALMEESLPQAGGTQVLEEAPRYISEGLTFPYQQGTTFVQTVFQQGGGFNAVDAMFDDPPQSTEQILHPQKYLQDNRDAPMDVEAPDLTGVLGSGWEETYTDTLGEWDLGIMLEVNGLSNADEAAAGWGGSDFNLYQSGDNSLTVLETRWDTEGDAQEFNEALTSTFDGMEQSGDLWTDGNRYFDLVSDGDTVTLVSGTDQTAVQDSMAEISSS